MYLYKNCSSRFKRTRTIGFIVDSYTLQNDFAFYFTAFIHGPPFHASFFHLVAFILLYLTITIHLLMVFIIKIVIEIIIVVHRLQDGPNR